MNHESLDKLLRRITPHEKDYKKGFSNPSIHELKIDHANDDGENIYVLPFVEDDFSPFTIKKHSRFQTYPVHVHQFIELNYMYSGTSRQVVNGTPIILEEGQLLFLNADTTHEISPLGENDILINILVGKSILNQTFFSRLSADDIVSKFFIETMDLNRKHPDFILFHSETSHRLRLFLNEMLCEWFSPSLNHFDITINLFTLILSELVNVYKNDYSLNDNKSSQISLVQILKYMEKNYRTCTLSSTASFFNLHPNYLSRLLKKYTGSSYQQLVQKQKIDSAKNLLKYSELSVTEIANYVGYENVSFFYKKFKLQCDCLPGEYRDMQLHQIP